MESLWLFGWIIFIFVLLILTTTGTWGTYAFCPCGRQHRVSFGDKFFVTQTCSGCGRDKSEFTCVYSAKLKIYPEQFKMKWIVRRHGKIVPLEEILKKD